MNGNDIDRDVRCWWCGGPMAYREDYARHGFIDCEPCGLTFRLSRDGDSSRYAVGPALAIAQARRAALDDARRAIREHRDIVTDTECLGRIRDMYLRSSLDAVEGVIHG